MASQREQAWSNDEKNYLLAEIIKSASPHPNLLYNIAVEQLNVQPNNVSWEDLALPRGRSLNSSRSAFDAIRQQPRPLMPMSSLGPQTPLSAPPVPTMKRPFPSLEAYPTGREIRPKLAPAFPATGAPAQLQVTEQAPKRRRGRPPKVQASTRLPASLPSSSEPIASGSFIPSQAQLSPVKTTATTSSMSSEETKSTLPPAVRMPISAVLTPIAPKPPSSSSSSSGKRRRGRSTRSEPDELGQVAGTTKHEYESPYGRTEGVLEEDTPARTAALRHREAVTTTQVSRSHSEPDPHLPAIPPQ